MRGVLSVFVWICLEVRLKIRTYPQLIDRVLPLLDSISLVSRAALRLIITSPRPTTSLSDAKTGHLRATGC